MSKHGLYMVMVLLISIALSYCTQKPDPPLPFDDDKIINILIDVHLAEAAMQSLGKKTKDSIKYVYYEQISQIHGIKSEDLDALLSQLRNQPNDMKRLYEEMMQRIEVMEKESEAKIDQDKKGVDTTDIIQIKEEELNQ